MAKMKNKKNQTSSSRNEKPSRGLAQSASVEEYDTDDVSDDTDSESDAEETNFQAAGSRQTSMRSSQESTRSSKKQAAGLPEIDPGQLLDTARNFIEGHPGRATLIGALVGGAVAGLFATEKGRSLVSAAYSYARPMIADYARNFINAQSQNAVEAALPQ